MAFSGRGESHERVTGERRELDVESMEMQRRANVWAVDVTPSPQKGQQKAPGHFFLDP
jgi:hypothetical protein